MEQANMERELIQNIDSLDEVKNIIVELKELIIALGGVLTLWFAKSKFRFKRLFWSYQRINQEALKAQIDIVDCLQRIRTETVSERVMVFEMCNGNKLLNPASNLKTTMLFEEYENMGGSMKEGWQNRPLDNSYRELLYSLMQKSYITIKRSDLEKDSVLRTVYKASGIKQAHVIQLPSSKGVYRYMSIALPTADKLSSKEQSIINDEVAKIKNLIKVQT